MRKKPDRKWIAILAVLAGMAGAAGASPSGFHKHSSNHKSFTAGAI